MTFGNGSSEQYEYDALDNLSSLCYNNSSTPAFTWTYDISGLLKSRYDATNRIAENYEYDSYSRLSSSTLKQTVDVYDEYEYEPSGTSLVTRLTTTYSYDNYGRNSSVGYAFANKSYTRSVTYGPSDRIDSYTISGALQKVNSYDALNRLSNVSLKNASNSEVIGTSYSYIGMLPSSEISSFTELYYTYDAANRITRIAEYGDDVACYAYDAQGQLIREDNAAANKTWIYTYDNYGNILTKSTYYFSTDDLEYLGSPSSVKTWNYTSSPLGKQLYQSSYDALGNPTYDHERSWSYTWNGRQLTEIMVDGGSPIFRAKYNEDGIRTHKAYSEDGSEFTYHDYILEGSLILQEHAYSFYSPDPWEDPVTYYTNYYYYDENGSLVGLNYNGTNYYYYKNILGDILGIVNSSGEFVVEYAYDAWGNIISTTGSMASTLGQANPFRYRGYYYDAETGFYYLNSRYYDPSACRFINADVLLDISNNTLGCNLYCYCLNNPSNNTDPNGYFIVEALNFVYKLTWSFTVAIHDSIEYEFGIGFGMGIDVGLGDYVSFGVLGIRQDFFNISHQDGINRIGGKITEGKLNLTFFNFFTFGPSGEHYYITYGDEYSVFEDFRQSPNVEKIENEMNEVGVLGIGGSIYYGVGITASIGFNFNHYIQKFQEEMNK